MAAGLLVLELLGVDMARVMDADEDVDWERDGVEGLLVDISRWLRLVSDRYIGDLGELPDRC